MKESIATRASGDDASLELGKVLGQSIAFGIIAGRCSAAQAAAIRKAREEKIHARFGLTWREFCPKHLKMSGAQADLFVRLLEEFGPVYFEHTQSVRISAKVYRQVAPFIQDKTLHYGEEVLELNPVNVRKVAEAVCEPQRKLPAPAGTAPEETAAAPAFADRLTALERHIAETVAEFREVAKAAREVTPPAVAESRFRGALLHMTTELKRVGLENGVV